MKEEDAPRPGRFAAANDNEAARDPVAVDAALTRIAEAIGRHIAREHIRARKAANDNAPVSKNPPPPKR
jgi:hypothetical protein